MREVSCDCGSGLPASRCCGLDPESLPAPASLELLNGMAAEASRLFNDRKPREAEALALKLLDLAPNHRMALRVLFEIRRAQNQSRAAEVLAGRLAGLPAEIPGQAAAANLQFAQLLIGQGRHAEAEAPAAQAVKLSPRDANAHHVLGVVFTETGRLREGELHYRQAAALRDPEEDGLLTGNLAWNLRQQGLLDDAAQLYGSALAARPKNRRAIGGFAQVETARGHFARAAELLDQGLAQGPDRSLRLLRAMLALRQGQPQAVLERLNDPEALLPAELILRGRALQRLGRMAEAITTFAQARQMQRERFGQHYRAAPFIEQARRDREFFTAARFAALPQAGGARPIPVFLLGFPGSGTSLLEQLLAQLPGIAAGDAFAPVEMLLRTPELAGYPESLAELLIGERQNLPAQLAGRFCARLAAAFGPQARYVTLRGLSDAWHLGLIKLLFPEAPVIHLLRHPLDVATANFARDAKLEGDCGSSLAAIARHYDLVMSMIRHYRSQLTLRYLPVRYETLVAEPAEAIRMVQEFIGAGAVPDDAALRANPPVSTRRQPGHAIAREPIHTRGLHLHAAFEAAAPQLFTEIRPILKPWIDELGYAA